MPAGSRIAPLTLLALLASCAGSADSEPVSRATIPPTTQPAPTSTVDSASALDAATSCPELAALVVDGLQVYVDAYATTTPQQVAQLSTDLGPGLEQLAITSGQSAAELGCSGQGYLELLAAELDRLQQASGVQRAIAGTFISGLLGGEDPSDPGASTFEVTTAAELDEVSRVAGTGSTIELAAGDYAIETSLVFLRGVTVVGAGADTTTITSTAPSAGLLVAARGTVTLQGLTVINEAPAASVLAITRGGVTLQDATIAGGRRDADGNGGYGLILAPDTTLGVGAHTIADTLFRDNDGGGILIDGPITPALSNLKVEATTGCAVCWLSDSGGSLVGASITGGEVGIRVEGAASPTISEIMTVDAGVGAVVLGTSTPSFADTSFSGASAGIAVEDTASPELVRVLLNDNVDVGLRLGGASNATVTELAVTGATAGGIGILDDATPTIIGGSIDITGEVGVLYSGAAGGTIDGLAVRGARIGIQVTGDAAPTLANIVAAGIGEAAALVLERGAGTIESMECDEGESGVIGLQTDGDITIADDVSCLVVEAG